MVSMVTGIMLRHVVCNCVTGALRPCFLSNKTKTKKFKTHNDFNAGDLLEISYNPYLVHVVVEINPHPYNSSTETGNGI